MDWILKHHEEIRNLGLVAAAVIGLPLAIWRSFIAQQQAKIQADNHLAETYTKAIDQIGHTTETIQLGGLYALEKIAISNQKYHRQIIEVLCSFIRLHASIHQPEMDKHENPAIIVQTALTIIGRRNIAFDKPPEKQNHVTIDLSESHLERANLSDANFQGANFVETNLEEANMQGTNFQSANFILACLNKSNLGEANLQETSLMEASLKGAKLEYANLQNALIPTNILELACVYTSTILPDHIDKTQLIFED